MSICLLQAVARWHPRKKRKVARLDFLRELDVLVKLLRRDIIEPWPPLRMWLERYANSPEFDRRKRQSNANSVKQFGEMRMLAEELEGISQSRLASARVAPWETLLAAVPETANWDDGFEIFLDGIRRQVVDSCSLDGCLSLREFSSARDIQNARFSKYWKPDDMSPVVIEDNSD